MKLPAMLFGPGPRVRRDAKKVITRLKRGRTIIEAFDDLGGLTDVEQADGPILLSYTHTPYPSFHLYAVLHRLRERYWETLVNPFDDALFEALIGTEWGVAMLLCEPGGEFFGPHERTLASGRYHRFLDAVLSHWPAFEAVGKCWGLTGFTFTANPLEASYTLINVLHACNIDNDTIVAHAHLGLPELLRRYPPEPEKYVPPQHNVQVLRTEEERLDFTRSAYATYYRQIIEDFDMTPKQLASTRAGYDAALQADGLDPALIDPYWHQRPEQKS